MERLDVGSTVASSSVAPGRRRRSQESRPGGRCTRKRSCCADADDSPQRVIAELRWVAVGILDLHGGQRSLRIGGAHVETGHAWRHEAERYVGIAGFADAQRTGIEIAHGLDPNDRAVGNAEIQFERAVALRSAVSDRQAIFGIRSEDEVGDGNPVFGKDHPGHAGTWPCLPASSGYSCVRLPLRTTIGIVSVRPSYRTVNVCRPGGTFENSNSPDGPLVISIGAPPSTSIRTAASRSPIALTK
jgi:hypothetical protein